MASSNALPLIEWNEKLPDVHTQLLTDADNDVKVQFTLPHIYYVGSDKHCGCGFRYAIFQNGKWPAEEWHAEEDDSHIKAQPNHERLVQLIRDHAADNSDIEFYGTWEADMSAPALSKQRISMEKLLDVNFCFRDRGYYIIKVDKCMMNAVSEADARMEMFYSGEIEALDGPSTLAAIQSRFRR